MTSQFSKDSPAKRVAWKRAHARQLNERVAEIVKLDPAYALAKEAMLSGQDARIREAYHRLELAKARAERQAFDELCAPRRWPGRR